ncbi:MAG: hypothetical protein IJO65_13460 [Lachnospiraceae bacterium]|nr:hypothetical protein [Lachnospiraceae bacterium]
MATWFCYGCHKNIGDNQYCPHCGMHRFGKYASINTIRKPRGILSGFFASLLAPSTETTGIEESGIEESRSEESQKIKEPMFSEAECLLYGIYPEGDEAYRKALELDVLSKNYKE